jgi:sugar-specific transcriptional regulator TrmB
MKINNKIISSLFILIFIIIFSYYNYDEYKYFHNEKIETKKYNEKLNQKINNFNVEDIKTLNDIEIYHTPNKELLNKIVKLINNAKKEILLETYMLTETRIQEALIKGFEK